MRNYPDHEGAAEASPATLECRAAAAARVGHSNEGQRVPSNLTVKRVSVKILFVNGLFRLNVGHIFPKCPIYKAESALIGKKVQVK